MLTHKPVALLFTSLVILLSGCSAVGGGATTPERARAEEVKAKEELVPREDGDTGYVIPKIGDDLYFTGGIRMHPKTEKRAEALAYLKRRNFETFSYDGEHPGHLISLNKSMWKWEALIRELEGTGLFERVGFSYKDGGNGDAMAKIKDAGKLGVPNASRNERVRLLEEFLKETFSIPGTPAELQVIAEGEEGDELDFRYQVKVRSARGQIHPTRKEWEMFDLSFWITKRHNSSGGVVHIDVDEMKRAVEANSRPKDSLFEEITEAGMLGYDLAQRIKAKFEARF